MGGWAFPFCYSSVGTYSVGIRFLLPTCASDLPQVYATNPRTPPTTFPLGPEPYVPQFLLPASPSPTQHGSNHWSQVILCWAGGALQVPSLPTTTLPSQQAVGPTTDSTILTLFPSLLLGRELPPCVNTDRRLLSLEDKKKTLKTRDF